MGDARSVGWTEQACCECGREETVRPGTRLPWLCEVCETWQKAEAQLRALRAERDRLREALGDLSTGNLATDVQLLVRGSDELARAAAELRAERDRLRDALRKLLLSRDVTWTGGNDWAEAVQDAIVALDAAEADHA